MWPDASRQLVRDVRQRQLAQIMSFAFAHLGGAAFRLVIKAAQVQ
jgi:hypothetical protein